MQHSGQKLTDRLRSRWRGFWLWRSGPRGFGRLAARLASRGTPPFHQRAFLADLAPRGFIDPDAHVNHPELRLGENVFIGGNVVLTRNADGGPIELESRVQIYGNSFLSTGAGGRILIGGNTHIQPGCHIHAYLNEVRIGREVEVAANCAFYSYDHGMEPGTPVMRQPLTSKGPILIGDGAWLGHGVTVLQGVTIGAGAVIAAGAVVTRDVPENAIAAGVPAKVIGRRTSLDGKITPIHSPVLEPAAAETPEKQLTHTPLP